MELLKYEIAFSESPLAEDILPFNKLIFALSNRVNVLYDSDFFLVGA